MKLFFLFYFLILKINCQEEEPTLIQAHLSQKSNAIIYNGNKYILSPYTHKKEEILEKNIQPKRFLEELEVARAAPFSGAFWFNLIMFCSLACFAGTMSGLTVGYLSIDSLVLEIKMENGTENEKYYAEKIYKLVHNHHWLLVTLLFV